VKIGTPPAWVTALVGDLASVFGLSAWTIRVQAVKRPAGRSIPNADGSATINATYLSGTIRVKPEIERDADGLEIVAHEVLHLVLGEMRDAAGDLADRITTTERLETVMGAYDRAEERAITMLARGLARHFDLLSRIEGDNAGAGTGHEITPGHATAVSDDGRRNGGVDRADLPAGTPGVVDGAQGESPAVLR